ncbi:site-specific DNA-methyltransferase [Crenobacter cavernae]|uniref:site-specific DNA-methyltransferase (adenine-specific) n=1 Tax=Crenobacter cavernae TaxID=2290923 RepID=A0ABY0FDM4_9NEIS|nr:site-specific DNA-methyltransferase [Crenobacter cavernae]RXZ42474.1 site-specific DNA-methyltransferase [Crenobacter cavernae]
MPTLTWVGKDKVVNHHHDVPFRVLNKQYRFSAHSPQPTAHSPQPTAHSPQPTAHSPQPSQTPRGDAGNRIIHGDNLEALKSLLPEFEGRVKCIYIDPPYNTGNEGWVYNDAVNDPKIKKWLGQVVGKEGEDLSRHDKWLCMMYPRLKLLHRLLRSDGVLFASIDRNEMATCKLMLEEIFGADNWVGEIAWRNVTDNNPTNISLEHEYVLCFAKSKSLLNPAWKSPYLDAKERLIELGQRLASEHTDKKRLQAAYTKWFREHKAEIWPFQDYKFIDCDGIYTGSRSVHNPGKEGYRYDVFHPVTKKTCKQPLMGYRFPYETMQELLSADRILFGEDETKLIELKLYVKGYKAKLSSVIELDGRTGTNELKGIFSESNRPFDYPKPSVLLEELLGFVTDPDDIVLDSFSGSGTTGHAVLKLNAQDGGQRRFILIETMDYAETITAERVRRVMNGYGEGNKAVAGLGGGFDYYTVGEPIFLPDEHLNETVGVAVLRDYVAYTEGIPADLRTALDNPYSPYLLGLGREAAWLFYYEADRATTLDLDFLVGLKFGAAKPDHAIVYADRCLLDKAFMARHGITFKKIPRDITRF